MSINSRPIYYYKEKKMDRTPKQDLRFNRYTYKPDTKNIPGDDSGK